MQRHTRHWLRGGGAAPARVLLQRALQRIGNPLRMWPLLTGLPRSSTRRVDLAPGTSTSNWPCVTM
jgi:hypothetical protein